MHLFAHGNYGWGSEMDEEEFYSNACGLNFGELGEKVLYVMKKYSYHTRKPDTAIYKRRFRSRKNKMTNDDITAIMKAKENHPKLMKMIDELCEKTYEDEKLRYWRVHFDKLRNAERRNAVNI